MQLCDINTVRELMEKYGLTLKKSYGQNFLINPEVPRRIAESSRSFADCDKPAGVIEIGPGVGALTQYLCQEYDKVLAIELDRGLIPLLHEALGEYDNYKVLEADFMKTDLASLIDEHFRDITDNGGTVSICANLPYYITSPVIMKIFESFEPDRKIPLSSVVVMIQLEVAQRIVSRPGSDEYGAITASIGLYADSKKLFDVSPGNFLPPPKERSAVVSMIPHGGIKEIYPDFTGEKNEIAEFSESVRETIALAFGQRRKTLINSMSSKYSKEKTLKVLEQCGIRGDIRGEKLSSYDFCKITHMLKYI